MCQATHVSPSAHYLFSPINRLPVLGWQQDPTVFAGSIISIAETFVGSLVRCDLLVPEVRLYNRSLSEIDGYRNCVKQLGLKRRR